MDMMIIDVNIFKQELVGVCCCGWGYDNEEDFFGVCCIVVLVFNMQGKVIVVLSVFGVMFQIFDDKCELFVMLMMDVSCSLMCLMC